MNHSILPPSSAHIWGAPDGCTGWVIMINSVPEEFRNARSVKSIEGDAAHELSVQLIDSAMRAGLEEPLREETIGKQISNTTVTDEMFDACELYSDNVAEVMLKTRIMGAPYLGIEKRIDIFRIHKKCFGTPDMFLYDFKNKILYIWDFKYGHVYVDEVENWQTITYATGLIDLLTVEGFNDPELSICIRIVQPRAYGEGGSIREWSIKATELVDYVNVLKNNANTALSSEAINHTGPHCRYCGARHTCPDALKAGLSLYESASTPMVQNMSLAALGTQYSIIERAKEQIVSLESGFQEQIKHLLKSGKNVPGYTLTPSIGRERWNRPDPEIITMGNMLKQNLSNGKALPPKQAREKGVDESVVAAFSERPNKGLKLVKSNTKLASKIFLTKES